MWSTIIEMLSKVIDTIIQYLPDILKARLLRKKLKNKTDTKNEMDKAKEDVVSGNVDEVNKRMEEYRKQKEIK